jgi:hypothetical protein
MVDEPKHTPREVREICDAWIDDRVEWFSEEDLDNPRLWWDIASQVLATGPDKISIVNGQLLASALFKIAHLEQAAINSRAERDA